MLKEKFDNLFEDQSAGLTDKVGYNGDPQEFAWGMDIELEHGTVNPDTNITDDDPTMTAKIALAHLNEIPDYYTRLRELEKQGKAAKKAEPEKEQPNEATHGEVPFDTFDKRLNEEIDSWRAEYYKTLFDIARQAIHETYAIFRYSFEKTPEQKLKEIEKILLDADTEISQKIVSNLP